jgi:hypothetical protein
VVDLVNVTVLVRVAMTVSVETLLVTAFCPAAAVAALAPVATPFWPLVLVPATVFVTVKVRVSWSVSVLII